MSKIVNALAIAAVATMAAAATPSTAEAKSFKSFHIIKTGHFVKPYHVGFKHYGYRHIGYVAPIYQASSCSFFYHKWQSSGAWYWKNKYLACKGW